MSQPVIAYAKPEAKERIRWLCVEANLVLCDVLLWCFNRGIVPVITEAVTTKDEDDALNRTSSTHREGRAFDISTRGWKRDLIDECVRVFSFKYRNIGAVMSNGDTKVVYFHNAGTGPHLHFQVHRRYSVNFVDSKLG